MNIINEFYKEDKEYSRLYEYVIFENIDEENITKFIELFDHNDMTTSTWRSISNRLIRPIKFNQKSENHKRKYKSKSFLEISTKENSFDGILNYLQTHCNIKDEINITYSSNFGGGDVYDLLQYENKHNLFWTNNKQNSLNFLITMI